MITEAETKIYHEQHVKRFAYLDELFNSLPGIKSVYDLGTWFPFSSKTLAAKGIPVTFGCEADPVPCDIANTTAIKCDLSKPPVLPPADLVICTECLEHLSCDLYKVRDYLVSLVNPGGYLFLSFPTGDILKGGYGETLAETEDKIHTHIREFPTPKAREFYQGTGLDLISEKFIKVEVYEQADGILNVLLRKR